MGQTMSKLTEKALATVIVIREMGGEVPTYMFQGHDCMDAIVSGLIKEVNECYLLTEAGTKLLNDLDEDREIDYEYELSTETKKVLQ